MAEDQVASNPLPLEIQDQMAMAFGGQPAAQPAPADAPLDQSAAPAPTDAPAAEQFQYVDPNVYLKEQLGFENWDVAKTEFQALKELREKAQTPAEIKFANDEAKKWYGYLNEGKEDDLYTSLHARQQIKNVDALNEEQKIKLFIKLQNPLFDTELVDYQFKKDYGFDESAFKDDEGNVTDAMGLRFAKVAAQQKMQNDITRANEYFSQYKTKIELPELNKPVAGVDQAYEEYKASTAKSSEDYNNVIAPAIKALKDTDLVTSVSINDPNNQMKFDVGITFDKEDFAKAQEAALNYGDYVSSAFYDQSGKFFGDKLVKAILIAENFDKYAQTIMRQAVNAERKRVIESETAPGGVRKMYTDEVKTELDKQMEKAFAV